MADQVSLIARRPGACALSPATPGQTDFGGPLCAGIRSVGKELMAPADFGTDLTASEGWPDVLDRQDCVSACKTDPLVECAPRGGQIRRAELTGRGLSKEGSPCQDVIAAIAPNSSEQVVAEYHAGETLHMLGRRHDVSRNLIRIWIEKSRGRCA